MMKHVCVLTFSLLLLAGKLLHGQPPKAEPTAEWFQQGYYILNPVFSRTTTEIAFARRLSGKDSSMNPQKTFAVGATANYLPKNSTDSRLLDPVISILNYKNRQFTLVDYGWGPAFSTNDNRLAYAFQLAPLQRPDRLYAETYKGNTIKIFNKSTRKIEEVAKPTSNYLLDPFFVDSLKLVYKTGDRVNGPYGGAVSFSEVDLASKRTRLVRQPGIKYRLYELMGEPYLVRNQLAYIVYSPADSGSGMASEYRHLLLSEKDTLHDFGIRKFTNLNYKFAVNASQELLFLDDEHFMAEDTNYLVKYKKEHLLGKRPLNPDYFRGYLSPDGRWLFYLTQDMGAFLVNTKDLSQIEMAISKKDLHAVVWSADGNKLGLVQDHESLAGTDKLLIFTLR
ncbi:hypothetical protein U0035_11890 [Niabella yanshanensis]|uniref:WD40-like Beta Propeller Repeat n=1 Tax=Niabella yanshanensis TaxID=577386 RepID=A0ABZ0VZL0_9BACT|nr:hypothetical protein [Niabella yanshanensis]WQD36366.1 hypothetical protein U0035_11890 [Niabella yanshanensis]